MGVIIKSTSVEEVDEKNIKIEMVGQKTKGLLEVPLSWRLPFFVIHKKVFDEFLKSDNINREKILSFVTKKIEEILEKWQIPKDGKIIMRSSGVLEGMSERGKYESMECEVLEIKDSINRLYCSLEKEGNESIAYVIQPYVERKKFGHLSNERRVSKDRRDWKLEYENGEESVNTIGVRKWRIEYERTRLISQSLFCDEEKNVKAVLRKVAYYFTEFYKNERVHLEFVWDGMNVYVVQCDREEIDENAENPLDYSIEINDASSLEGLKVFREISIKDGQVFSKVENVILYKKMGLITAPLYIIDDKNVITSLEKGIITPELKNDIELLTSKSLVIRTDVKKGDRIEGQLLPRSNELRNYESAITWFKENLHKILEYDKIAIIAHIFIPAISAAFAYANPKSKIVTVQSLWGLPEGLYYNAHDTFLLDVGTKNIQHIDEEKIKITSFQADFKSVYIAPNEQGRWEEKVVKAPHDWGKSITDRQAKTIAKGSIIIAQNVKMPVSIMWFVGIDKEFYGVDCLPWFHEEYGNNTFSHDTYKKKYYTEKEIVITNEKDLDKYENDNKIRTITIHPKDDQSLRSKEFLSKVGEFAKRKNITIFLEGTILAHPVYQLMNQGVKVVLAKKNKELIDKMQFDKLVRDKIPEKIISNMENIVCYRAKETILIRYLKEKMIEEVYEVIDANSEESLSTELADVYEVMKTIKGKIGEIKEWHNVLRTKEVNIEETDKLILSVSDMDICNFEIEKKLYSEGLEYTCNIDRLHQDIELEIKINKKQANMKNKPLAFGVDKKRRQMLDVAYKILDEKDVNKLTFLCDDLEKIINYNLEELHMSKEEFVQVCSNKNKRNGGFEEGFVLQETRVYTTEHNKVDSEGQIEFEFESTEEYPQLQELLFSPMNYIDFRRTDKEELLIRIKYPLCFERWGNEFMGVQVENMYGPNTKLLINAYRNGTKYSFDIYLRCNHFEQRSFEIW